MAIQRATGSKLCLGVPEEDHESFQISGHAAAMSLERQLIPGQDPKVVASQVDLAEYLR